MRWNFAVAAILFVTGCVPSEESKTKSNIFDYPEAHVHSDCLDRRAYEFSKMDGNTIDLAYVAAGGCRQTRLNLAMAIGGSATFVRTFVDEGQDTDTRLIAEKIYRIRSGQ